MHADAMLYVNRIYIAVAGSAVINKNIPFYLDKYVNSCTFCIYHIYCFNLILFCCSSLHLRRISPRCYLIHMRVGMKQGPEINPRFGGIVATAEFTVRCHI